MKLKALVIALCLAAAAALPSTAYAATIAYKGVSLSPAVEQLVINPDQSDISFQIRLDNNQNVPLTLQASSLDFKSLNDSGGLAFITSNPSALEDKYGLANWINLPAGDIVLPPGGGQFVTVTIDNRNDLASGGHYAAVLFRVVSPTGLSGNKVEVDQVISSLIFLRKTGGDVYSVNLTKAAAHRNWAWLGWPTRLDTYFYNGGNVQTAPRGTIQLNKTISILNPNSSLVLPSSSRLISTELNRPTAPIWPGIYHVTIIYRPDSTTTMKTASLSFIYLSWETLMVILLAVLLLIRLNIRRCKRAFRWLWRQVKRTKVWWLGLGRSIRWLGRAIIKTVRLLFKGLLWLLIQVDTWGGRAWNAWDKRQARKRK